MMSNAHGGYRAGAHGEMVNTWALGMGQSGDMHRDTMKYTSKNHLMASQANGKPFFGWHSIEYFVCRH
jgi:hypothetical protein